MTTLLITLNVMNCVSYFIAGLFAPYYIPKLWSYTKHIFKKQ